MKETTVVISLQTSQMQDQCKYVRRGKAQNVSSIYGPFPLPVFGNDACHRHDRPLTRPAFSSREGLIERPKLILYKLVQLRFSWGHRARCFLGDLSQHWCILREYVMGFFPDSTRIWKQVWVPGMCFAQLAHLDSAKESWGLHLCLISERNISCSTWKVLRCLCEI